MIEIQRPAGPPAHHADGKTVVGRLGTPADVAAVVRMLLGPRARYTTGQTFHVNGGAYMP